MQIELTNRIALVTGASRGIGRAVALEFALAGADVALTARSEADLESLASEIRAMGRRALPIVGDVLEFAFLERAVSSVQSELGPVDILVNNAGITQGVKFSDQSYELWQRVQRVNVDAAMRLTQLTIEGMAARRWGRVINIASIAAKAGLRYSAAYNASKHALLGLTRSLALDYATRGVSVNAVCPGWVATEMVEETVTNIVQKTGRSREEALMSLVKDIPQQQMVQAEEVAALVLFLASSHARAITGQGLNIDGGTVMN